MEGPAGRRQSSLHASKKSAHGEECLLACRSTDFDQAAGTLPEKAGGKK
jgi:hypothetical protein